MPNSSRTHWLTRLRKRGVIRVATSYAVIAWLLLQIADVSFEPLGIPGWIMTALIVAALLGFPVAILLAWFLELGDDGISRDSAGPDEPRPRVHGLRRFADVAVIGVLVIVVAALLVQQSNLGRPPAPENPAIAVLPFENLTGDPEQEYFSDGLAEEMLDRLGRVPGLRVIARSSSFGFKGRDVDARTIAEKLGVTTLLEGSVRRDGQRLKLAARLIDGATGQQVWSGSFDREMSDVFAVQAELAGAVVNAIVPAARGTVVEDAIEPASDLDAYDLYLAARTQLALRLPRSIAKSVELMEQALRLDPDFARGQAHLANSLLFQAMFLEVENAGDAAALLRRAETSIHKALALDPDLSEAHGAYANLLRETGRPGAEEQYRRALELNPNNAASWHDYAVYLTNFAGRPDESHRAVLKALELDPRQPATWANHLGNILEHEPRRYGEVLQHAIRVVGDMPFAIDRMTSPATAIAGYPVEFLRAGLAKDSTQADNIPTWVNRFRAWVPVDLERAAQVLASPDVPGSRLPPAVRAQLFFAAEVAGRQGDWTRLDEALGKLHARFGDADPTVASVTAFWLTVRDRHDEAAKWLARAEPVPQMAFPATLGTDTTYGLMDTARVRIYRATGRNTEAGRLAEERLQALRAQRSATGTTCTMSVFTEGSRGTWLEYASLAANEGLKDEAVEALEGALRCGELPWAFEPALPWFRDLEGHPPYDELLRERERRVARIRATLEQLEAAHGRSS